MFNMIYFKNIDESMFKTFINSKYWCYDCETCAHTAKIYNDYFVKQTNSTEKGIHARVYAWALSNTSDDTVIYGNTVNDFIECLDMFSDYIFKIKY